MQGVCGPRALRREYILIFHLNSQKDPKYMCLYFLFLLYFFCFVLPCPAACGILVPWAGIEPMSHPVEAQSLNHWTTREVPCLYFLKTSWTNIKPWKQSSWYFLFWKLSWLSRFVRVAVQNYFSTNIHSSLIPIPNLILWWAECTFPLLDLNWILENSMVWPLKYAYTVGLVFSHSYISVWREMP